MKNYYQAAMSHRTAAIVQASMYYCRPAMIINDTCRNGK